MRKTIFRILTYTKPYRAFFVLAFFCGALQVALSLLGPVLIGNGIDFIVDVGQVSFEGILRTLVPLGITIVACAFFQWLMAYFTNLVAHRTVRDMRIEIFHKLSGLPLRYLDGHSHGDLISRVVNDIDLVSEGLLQGLTQLFTGIATILGTLVIMLVINPAIALIVVLITPLSIFVASFIAKHSNHMFKEQSATQGELSGYVEEMIGGQRTVKAFCHEEQAQEGFRKINARLYACGVQSQFYSSLTNPSTRFVNSVVYAAVGISGAIAAIHSFLSIGQIATFLSYANQYTKPFNEITGVITQLQTAVASADRIFAVLDEETESSDDGLAALPGCRGSVVLDNVSFSYSPQRPLIENLNLSVKPGERIAIVGPTGCGKTTIINLLMRFYDVTGGAILLDGRDVRTIPRSSLRSQFGMVLQDTWLFSGTIRENIAYAKPGASEEEITAAAKSAYAHGFIKRLPKGYDTVISENGGNISQGQKQLLCIARVMLADPPMLILDEATSNIDTMTEIRVQQAFAKMMEGRTSFIVAHRLSTIREADLILVMQSGHIVEQGTHDELLGQNGFYAKLYNSQFVQAEA